MPTFAAELGMQAASQAASGLIGTGMGLLLEGHNDRRQSNKVIQTLFMAFCF